MSVALTVVRQWSMLGKEHPTTDFMSSPLIGIRPSILVLAMALAACGGGGSGGSGNSSGGSTVNRAPERIGHNPNQTWYIDHGFSYDANADGRIFRDPDGDPLTYEFKFNSQTQPLPGFSVSGSVVSGVITYHVTGLTIGVVARDSGGNSVEDTFTLEVKENSRPAAVQPNSSKILSIGAVNYDAAQSGATFRDADGHKLTYSLEVIVASTPFTIEGTRLAGVFSEPGFVKARLRATDELGAATDDVFMLVVPSAISNRPTLPASSHIYDDDLLPLPNIHRMSRQGVIPLWDTTPADNPTSNAGATLGRVLFYDKRLSVTNAVSCGSCHEQARGFTIGTRFAVGVFGEQTRRNPMALANSRYNLAESYFHDMRVRGLEALALLPIQDQLEMGNTLTLLEQKLAITDFYPPLFQAAFGTPAITSDRIARALAQFLRSLISYRAKFDLAFHPLGDDRPDPNVILTSQELRGLEVLRESRCMFCHTPESGAMNDASNNGLDVIGADPGIAPEGRFRGASLRNIAVSGPYMHDGRFATLREVIDFYDSGVQQSQWLSLLLRDSPAATPRRLNLSEDDKQALEALLNTFTDTPLLTDPKFADPFQ